MSAPESLVKAPEHLRNRGTDSKRPFAGTALAAAHARPVGEVMSQAVVSVAPDTEASVARLMAEDEGIHHLIVLDNQRLMGIVCEYDLFLAKPTDRVSACMKAPIVCSSSTTLEEAALVMRERAIGCLPVMEGDIVAGIVTRGDLRRAGLLVNEVAIPPCASCGTDHHVRLDPRTEGAAFCLECLERAGAVSADDDLRGGD
jgi:CBS domain-containing protein